MPIHFEISIVTNTTNMQNQTISHQTYANSRETNLESTTEHNRESI